ncbi:HEAT repeat-containing protein 1 [Hyla sarda]|uniref:HEAT repeat-containing protein 1 n=1 Tax=Hyla sarda TaxID=327740 RepID=UPI0024C455C4|nr:HEAT repeat-containing protein 1 [Hyla sarda]XP_056423507.1 HEAT repeat-containing protein 1 [Hyla sarda]
MTSLAHQLKRLALPQNDPSLLARNQVASLLFDPAEAANIDRETFYALGCTGLEELMGIDASFAIFEETLFSDTSKSLERSVQSKAVNQQLDENISLFLTHLSPYFMLRPAQKCMEWLIHRFHIHLYNQDSLIGCVLPYHETKVFVRVIQLLKIEDPTHRWNWLHPIQKPGVPLARSTVITHCYKDMGFMEFICNLVTKSIKVFSEDSESKAKLRVLISFYCSTIVAALEAVDTVSQTFVAKLLPYVQKGLKSSLEDYKAATYMIVCQLAVKTVMEATLVKALASQLSRNLPKTPSLMREGVGSIIILLQRQQSKDVGRKPFLHLCKVPELVDVLQKISSTYDTSSLLEYLLPNLVRAIVPSSTEHSADDINPEMCKTTLEAIIFNIPLQKDLDKLLARTFLQEFLAYGEEHEADDEKMSELGQCFLPLIRLLENKYPEALDLVLERQLKTVKDEEKQDLFHQFIALSTSGGKHELLADCDTSLLLSLNHPQAAVRQLALLHLKDIIETSKAGFDESFIKEAILARLKDDNIEVVLSSLQAFKIYLSHFTTEEMVSVLLTLFDRADLSQADGWSKAIKDATELIIQEHTIKDHPELCNRIIMAFIPHMVFTNNQVDSAEGSMAVFLGRSGVCRLHPLLKDWPEALSKSLENAQSEKFAVMVNSSFSQLLSTNMAAMDSSTVLQMVEELLQVADKDTILVRQKVTFHVLSHGLVAGCASCQNPDLQVSMRIFQLLDKKLRNVLTLVQEKEDRWLLDKSSGDQLYRIVLAEYITKLNSGKSADMEEAVLLLLQLKIFLNNLNCPESFPEDVPWWNPETMDSLSKNYLQLLIGLFSVIVMGASDGMHIANFRFLMGFLFSNCFKGPIKLFNFLCLLWTYTYNLSSPLGCTVNAVLQTQALYIGQAILVSKCDPSKKKYELISSPVVVSLLINLGNPIREVRRGAIACLSTLKAMKESNLYPVIEGVIESSEEIVADCNFVTQTLGSVFDHMQTSGSKKINPLKELLSLLQNPSCPSYVGKVVLRVLHCVNGEDLLTQLFPVLISLLEKVTQSTSDVLPDEAFLLHLILGKFNEHSAGLLSKNPQYLDIFMKALRTPQVLLDGMPSFQITAIGQITKTFFSSLDGPVQQKLLGALFDLLVDSKSSACIQAVSSAFKSISVNAVHVSAELGPSGRDKAVTSVRQTRRNKMQTQRKQQTDAVEEGSVNWSRTTIILELLQHKKKLKEPQHLVPTLFYLLSRCLEPSDPEQGNMEYTKQLILSCLLNICQKVLLENEKDAKEILDEEKFNVELIVQCVRTSEMPQTHHHALLLLGTAAGIFPDKVLHNIMPIFTFMGASVMRLDDSYSFQVISKTVQTVIPALIEKGEQTSKETKENVEQVVEKIIHVFVDALPHVPEHRRLPILCQLLDTVVAERFLWVLLVLLFQQHVTKTVTMATNGEKDAVLERDTEFWVSVCCEFSVQIQLESLISVLKFLTKLPENKEDDDPEQKKSKVRKQKVQKENTELFNVETHSAKQLRHFKFLAVSFMANLLASHTFVGKVVECEAAEELQELEQRILEEVLCYIKLVAGSVEANADKPTAKFWRALLNKSYELLDKVNSLLPTETFIPVIRGLMSNHLPSVRRKAMDLLNNKLHHRTQWNEQQIELLLGLVKDLLSVAQKKGSLEGDEQAINRQTALYSLKLLCKCFGSNRQQVFLPVLSAAVNLISSEQPEEKNVVGSALLCIAEITGTVKALAIPQLPRLMPALLTTLKHRKELLTSEIHLLSTVTALQKVVETLPHFLSPYLQDSLLQVTRLDKIAVKVGPTSTLSVKVSALKTTLATKLAARVLLPAVTQCYCHLLETQQQVCLGSLMDILREHIATMEKQQLSSHQSELTTFFLKALDYRAEHTESDLKEVGSTEGHIIDCFLIMIMKLSEATFRPLFFKLFDWSKTEGSSKDRLLTFCRLSDCIADKLKGLFTLFAGHLVKPFAEILNQTNAMKTDEAFFDLDDNNEKSCLLLEYVLNCLHKIFLYDTQHFVSKERAEALMMPLVDQIENLLGGDEKYHMRVSQSLSPCIAQFSVAVADDSLWKPLNYQILLKMRHSSPKVRFAALLVLVDLVEKLRENYMVLLPEAIPFLAELMEDECEEVEQQCQKTIKQLENFLGESLQSYF